MALDGEQVRLCRYTQLLQRVPTGVIFVPPRKVGPDKLHKLEQLRPHVQRHPLELVSLSLSKQQPIVATLARVCARLQRGAETHIGILDEELGRVEPG